MAPNKNRCDKTDTIRFLKTMRKLLVGGFALSALATSTLIICGAIVWFGRSDLFSGDWWGAASWCFLAYFVLMLYVWMTVAAWGSSGTEIPIADWIVGYLFVPNFIAACFLFNITFFMLTIFESNNAPAALGSSTAVAFIASFFAFNALCETNTQIREKTDPNFKRSYGFS